MRRSHQFFHGYIVCHNDFRAPHLGTGRIISIRTKLNAHIGRLLGRTGRVVALLTGNRISSHGVVVDTTSPLIADETRASLFWGYYEGAERRAVLAYLRNDLPIIEVGASIGFLSSLIARAFPANVQIAVEANPQLIPILQTNLRANGGEKVRVVAAAIAYGSSQAAFAPVADTASGKLAEPGESRRREVATTSLEKLLADAPAGSFSLVCDIEGAEYELFLNEPECVRSRCALAVMELHEIEREGARYSRPALADWLCAQWKMKMIFNDGKVWVLGR